MRNFKHTSSFLPNSGAPEFKTENCPSTPKWIFWGYQELFGRMSWWHFGQTCAYAAVQTCWSRKYRLHPVRGQLQAVAWRPNTSLRWILPGSLYIFYIFQFKGQWGFSTCNLCLTLTPGSEQIWIVKQLLTHSSQVLKDLVPFLSSSQYLRHKIEMRQLLTSWHSCPSKLMLTVNKWLCPQAVG